MGAPKTLQAVARRTAFEFPEAYLSLLAAGATSYGPRGRWVKNWKKIALTSPPALMCAGGQFHVEWMKPAEIKAWQPDAAWDPDLQLVPFAVNAYGDTWCWCLDYEDRFGVPIALLVHDEEEAQLFAANFPAFLLRSFVNSLVDVQQESISELGGPDMYVEFLRANYETIKPQLKPAWNRRLAAAVKSLRPAPGRSAAATHSFLAARTLRAILKDYVLVGQVDYWFPLAAAQPATSEESVPDNLAELMPLARQWAVGEWWAGLENRFASASPRELNEIRRRVPPKEKEINRWINRTQKSGAYSEAAKLLLALSTIAFRLERWEGPPRKIKRAKRSKA